MNTHHWIWTGCLGALLAGTLPAMPAEPAAWKNQVGLQLVADEDNEIGWALYASRDLSARDRLFLQVEMQEFEDSRRWTEGLWSYRAQTKVDALEFELGYLRRLTPPGQPWGLHAGPSLGVVFSDGTYSVRASGGGDDLSGGGGDLLDDDGGTGEEGEDERDGDTGNKAAGDPGAETGDIEYDAPGLNLYAVALADYVFPNHVTALAMFSYGYAFERDGQFKPDGGPSRSFTEDDDFFWNLALGAAWAF